MKFIWFLVVLASLGCMAQDLPNAPSVRKSCIDDHCFWGKENVLLFSAGAVGRSLDMYSTWRFRSLGYQEVTLTNGFVDNKPAYVAYSIGTMGASIGAAYLLHRMHHHKLEKLLTASTDAMIFASVGHNFYLVSQGPRYQRTTFDSGGTGQVSLTLP